MRNEKKQSDPGTEISEDKPEPVTGGAAGEEEFRLFLFLLKCPDTELRGLYPDKASIVSSDIRDCVTFCEKQQMERFKAQYEELRLSYPGSRCYRMPDGLVDKYSTNG